MSGIIFQEILLALSQIANDHNTVAGQKLHGSDTDVASFCLHQGKAYGVQDAIDAVKIIEARYDERAHLDRIRGEVTA